MAIAAWFAFVVVRRIGANFRNDRGEVLAVRVGAVLGIAGVVVHSLVDFGLHLMSNALIFIVLTMLATASVKKMIDPGVQHQ